MSALRGDFFLAWEKNKRIRVIVERLAARLEELSND
jgi:hypothetical protein